MSELVLSKKSAGESIIVVVVPASEVAIVYSAGSSRGPDLRQRDSVQGIPRFGPSPGIGLVDGNVVFGIGARVVSLRTTSAVRP